MVKSKETVQYSFDELEKSLHKNTRKYRNIERYGGKF